MGMHWICLFVKPIYTVYFDSFGIEHIPKEINKFIRSKELGSTVDNNDTTKSSAIAQIKSNIFRIQAYDSIMCRYFCIEFINYILKGKNLLDYTNLFLLMTLKRTIKLLK